MPVPARKKARYEDLRALPDNMVGEIVEGELIATPRPSPRHGAAASALGGEIIGPFQFGRGGPGGWLIIHEPELHLDGHVLVPDLAGWRKERMPAPPEENWFSVAPDWVCEVLSPGTVQTDRLKKMPIYARYEIPYLWIIDPREKTLEVFRQQEESWYLLSVHGETEKVRAEPFQEIEIDLALLFWT